MRRWLFCKPGDTVGVRLIGGVVGGVTRALTVNWGLMASPIPSNPRAFRKLRRAVLVDLGRSVRRLPPFSQLSLTSKTGHRAGLCISRVRGSCPRMENAVIPEQAGSPARQMAPSATPQVWRPWHSYLDHSVAAVSFPLPSRSQRDNQSIEHLDRFERGREEKVRLRLQARGSLDPARDADAQDARTLRA